MGMGKCWWERGGRQTLCALWFRPPPWAVLAVAPIGPFLLVAGSAPTVLLDFQAALRIIGTRNSE